MPWWFWVILGVFVLVILPTFVISSIIYTVLLVRTNPKKWGRECSIPDDEEYLRMFNIGIEWEKKYAGNKKEVGIVSEGFHLFGEYFDFGAEKAVIIIPGRMESLLYSYYFAEPFRKAGYNVLTIDNRTHGLSDGKINSLYYREWPDLIAWSRFLHDNLHNSEIVMHGICIGASGALYALTSNQAPDYIRAMIAEGMYINFYESLKNHMIEQKRPLYPFAWEVALLIRLISHANVVTDGPLWRIDKLTRPILMLQSEEDTFSLPEKAKLLYEKCPSTDKHLVYFPTGIHSRIRINNTEKYDQTIIDFLRNLS